MSDLWHEWGNDLIVGATGDLLLSSEADLDNQRILRRLLTNLGDYIWELRYGAGLGGLVGQPVAEMQLRALIRSQIFKETSVARSPEPIIALQAEAGAPGGSVFVTITYTQAADSGTQTISFSLGN